MYNRSALVLPFVIAYNKYAYKHPEVVFSVLKQQTDTITIVLA